MTADRFRLSWDRLNLLTLPASLKNINSLRSKPNRFDHLDWSYSCTNGIILNGCLLKRDSVVCGSPLKQNSLDSLLIMEFGNIINLNLLRANVGISVSKNRILAYWTPVVLKMSDSSERHISLIINDSISETLTTWKREVILSCSVVSWMCELLPIFYLSLVIQKMLLSLSILCCKTLKSQWRNLKGIWNHFRKIIVSRGK